MANSYKSHRNFMKKVASRQNKVKTTTVKGSTKSANSTTLSKSMNKAQWSKDYNASRDPNVQRSKATPYSRNKAAKGSSTSYDVERIAMAGKDAGLSKRKINLRIKQYLANQNAGVKAARDTAVTLGSEAAGAYTSQAAAGAASSAYTNNRNDSNQTNDETNQKIEKVSDQLKRLEETMYGSDSGTQTQNKSTTDKNGINDYESSIGAR